MTTDNTTNGPKTRKKSLERTESKTQTVERPPYTGRCTFCGATMEPGETICEECGMPVDGVSCPRCGTRNYRTFCSKCNAPLTRAAQRAIEKAVEDPKVIQVAKLMDHATELEEALTQVEEGPAKEQAQEEYQRVVKDINQLFEEMLPPAGSTPEEQYNYYSARKVAVETVRVIKKEIQTGWVCNYCGCHHQQPSECAEPWHGGTWIYKTITETVRSKEYKYEE